MNNKVKISEVIGHYLVLKKMDNKMLVGLCPFHPDTRPSLVVDDSTDTFLCKECKAKGSSLDFVMNFKAIAYEDAQKIIQEMSNNIYSCTRTGRMEIRDKITIDELFDETTELMGFISSIEMAPEWRDVSITELVERIRAVIVALEKMPSEQRDEKIYEKLLKNLLKFTEISYRHEFGHPPYCDLESDEVSRWMDINEDRLRKEKSPVVQFAANIFHRLGKILRIG